MKIEQKSFSAASGWKTMKNADGDASQADLTLVFGSKALLQDSNLYPQLRQSYPKAQLVMASTAGEIIDTQVCDDTLAVTAVKFDKAWLKSASVQIQDFANSFEAGKALAGQMDPEGLVYVLVLSDGQLVNGSELAEGLVSVFAPSVIVTGGLAGDGSRFQSTLLGLNAAPAEGVLLAVGFYGPLRVNFGSVGGWSPFGPERLITRSAANVLFELDGMPALDIYKKYLGEHARNLPSSGLLFPLSIRQEEKGESLVRTILNINEEDKSLVFAGNMPEGSYARLMKANYDRLIEGSSAAAQNSIDAGSPELAILISCVGRKLVLDQRIEEEVEVVRAVYGNSTAITGFYSYGEICPSGQFKPCELHNQTMTITTLTEE